MEKSFNMELQILLWMVEILLRTFKILLEVKILLWTFEIYYGKLRFYDESLRNIINDQDFITNGHNILLQNVEILLWTAEIFMITSGDFFNGKLRFAVR